MTGQETETVLPVRMGKGGVIVSVSLMPKASRDEVVGVETGPDDSIVLKARVRAIPDKGKANRALVELLAGWLDIPKTTLSIASGSRSRIKSVHIRGDETELLQMIVQQVSLLDD